MADFQSSIIIRKPVEEVFKYLLTLENIPEIMPNVVKLEKLTEGPIKKGTKLLETRNVRGRETKAEIEMTEYERNQIYQTKSVAGGITITYTYLFATIEEGTQVQFEADVKIKGLFSFFSRRALVKIMKQEDGYLLQYLKEELEGTKEENVQ
ncbi:SRPBCC family protein [Robertmurraya massiliosenegalensis]|uniref:SRPBCC family protein n=1 Tax=Robertmurraya TaxID=2837507 RepID=UPI0039A7309C